jgi:hypothetical protein
MQRAHCQGGWWVSGGVHQSTFVRVRRLCGHRRTLANGPERLTLATIVAPRGGRLTERAAPPTRHDGVPVAGKNGRQLSTELRRGTGREGIGRRRDLLSPSLLRTVRGRSGMYCLCTSATCRVRRRLARYAHVRSALLYRLLYFSHAAGGSDRSVGDFMPPKRAVARRRRKSRSGMAPSIEAYFLGWITIRPDAKLVAPGRRRRAPSSSPSAPKFPGR